MCVHICTYVCLYTYKCIYVCTYVCKYVHTYIHTYIYVYMYTCTYIYIDKYVYMYTLTNMLIRTGGATTHCNTTQLTATPCNTWQHNCNTSATHLPHICHTSATHLQHICNTSATPWRVCSCERPTSVCVAVCYSVLLQCVAAVCCWCVVAGCCCSVLLQYLDEYAHSSASRQHTHIRDGRRNHERSATPHCTNPLQEHAATNLSILEVP